MRHKIFVPVLALLTLFVMGSCSSSKSASQNVKKKDIRGTWTVSSVSIEGLAAGTKIKTVAFDDVPYECFQGSQWYLPNSGFGTYNIASANCMTGERKINWSFRTKDGVNTFNFKKMDGVKRKDANDVDDGYKLVITDITDNGFTAKSPVVFEGKTIYFVYNFVKG